MKLQDLRPIGAREMLMSRAASNPMECLSVTNVNGKLECDICSGSPERALLLLLVLTERVKESVKKEIKYEPIPKSPES